MSSSEVTLVALGSAVAQARRDLGWTQKELAARADLNRGYLAGIETGQRNLGFENLTRISATLGIPTSELLRRAERLSADRV